MLFNSYPFIFAFFPVVFIGFFIIAARSHHKAALWLAGSSLFFYGWWSPKHLPLLLASILFSFYLSKGLLAAPQGSARRKRLLVIGIATHLLFLSFFKYGAFIVYNLNALLGVVSTGGLPPLAVDLPIGISFYTFTQIAFLVDCWQGKVIERKFSHYLLFVTFFPHLIAGPVLHHAQMMPQFGRASTYKLNTDHIARGFFIFVIGLSKKLLIADSIAEYANALFDPSYTTPMFLMSWFGVLSYTFQIYFDFSGYSDMAIGLSLFFGIRLPINFNSPYKATNIIDFWRRWHISLSSFLRDYLYIPLGGNKHGALRRYINLFITMLLGGLWHGASWTFVLWGALHGIFLALNHLWRKLFKTQRSGRVAALCGWAITFVAVCVAWVLFRAQDVAHAMVIYKGMLGINGFSLPEFLAGRIPQLKSYSNVTFDGIWQGGAGQGDIAFFIFIFTCLIACFALRNVNAVSDTEVKFNFTLAKGIAIGVLFALCLIDLAKNGPSLFLYFRF